MEKEKPSSTETGEPPIIVSEQVPQEENISTTSTTTTVAASLTTTSMTTTPAATSTTSSGTKPKAPPKAPKEDFDATYWKENQCVCRYEAVDRYTLRVHMKNQHPRNYYRCWGLLKSSTTGSERRCPFETEDQGVMWRHYRTKHLGLY